MKSLLHFFGTPRKNRLSNPREATKFSGFTGNAKFRGFTGNTFGAIFWLINGALQKNLLGTFFPSIKSITNYFSEVNG
jgi:hypothetical protein